MYVCIYFSDYIVIIDYILDYNIFASYCVLYKSIFGILRVLDIYNIQKSCDIN